MKKNQLEQKHDNHIHITRVKIPLGYDYMGEFTECPGCHEEGYVYGSIEQNENGGFSGDFMCVKCEFKWSKL